MTTTVTRHLIPLLFCLALPGTAAAADYRVQQDQSRLGFSATFQGASFQGSFSQWHADIRFDPTHLGTSKFDVSVDTTSAATGDSDRDGALPGADFFNATKYPQAHYLTTGFMRLDGNRAIARGNLTLRGVSHPLNLTVTFTPQPGGGALMDVTGTLKRLDYGVGGGEYADTSVIGNDVTVNAHLVLAPK
ncbi:MAG: YceI family protein [Frateuria sp.]|uniref:YceI family protein n=1 Tax=Frateuria sp. TaxID=2211372 RepID=UPI0017D03A32|nr:YceI family protein [Frateuria sp.]NUO73484.1 YceI family protein [Frateuria sp.]NUR24139.1 YceI family protein [Frateuria sp.]